MKIFKKETKDLRPRLVIISGCAGSGKTHIGKALASRLKYAFIDKDTVTRQYTDFVLRQNGSFEGDRESELYVKELMPIEYDITLKLCKENLSLGNSVVLTMPFISYIRDSDKFFACICKEFFTENNMDIKTIWIAHDIDLEYKRVKSRNATRDRNKLQNWMKYSESIDSIEPDSRIGAYIFNNDLSGNFADKIEEVIKWIIK